MSTVDNRVVQLEMDNQQFEAEAERSIKTLDKLKESMNFDDAAKNLSGLSSKFAKNLDFDAVSEKLDGAYSKLEGRLSTWKLALANAMGNIASGLFGDLIIDPIKQSITGGIARSQNIADAKFQLEGLGVAWEEVKKDIDYAVDGTAYGLDVAAKAASQLSASGVQLGDDMKAALRGISGVAAMGAAEYEEITPIFTKAAGQGRVMADELNRISVHGLNAASSLAEFFNNIEAKENIPQELVEQVKSVTGGLKVSEADIREFASKSKISFEMFAYAMDSAFGEHAKDANKTFKGALSNMKAALNRIGENFRAPIMDAAIGVFNQFREIINAIKALLADSGIFEYWSKTMYLLGDVATKGLGKIKDAISGFKGAQNISNGLARILYNVLRIGQAIGNAFTVVFGNGKNGGGISGGIQSAAEGFEKFTERLTITEEGFQKLIQLFTKVFTVIKNLKSVIGDFLSKHGDVIKFKLAWTAVGAVLIKIVKTVSMMDPWKLKFAAIGSAIFIVVKAVKWLASNWSDLTAKISKTSPIFQSIFENISKFGNVLKTGFALAIDGAFSLISKVSSAIKNFKIGSIKDQFLKVKSAIAAFLDKMRTIPIVGKFLDNLAIVFDKIITVVNHAKEIVVGFFLSATGHSDQMTKSIKTDMSSLQSIGTAVLNVFKTIGMVLGGVVLGAMNLFNKAFEGLRNINMESIVSKLKDFVASIKNLTILDVVKKSLESAGNGIVTIFNTIIDKIKSFIDKLKTGDYSLDGFAEKVKSIIDILTTFKNKVVEAFTGGSELTRGGMGGGPLAGVMQALGDKINWLKGVFGDGMAYIKSEGLLTKGLMIAYVLAILKALISFSGFMKKTGDAISNPAKQITAALVGDGSEGPGGGLFGKLKWGITNLIGLGGKTNSLIGTFFDNISNTLQDFANANKKSKMEQVVDALKALAIVLAVLAGAIRILSDIPSNDLEHTIKWFGGLMIVITVLAGIMAKINEVVLEEGQSQGINSFAATLAALAIAMGVLAAVIWALQKLDWGKAIPGFIALAGVIAALYLVVRAMDKLDTSGTTIKGALFILAMAVMLRSITKSMIELCKEADAFANMDPKALYSIAGLMLAFGVLCAVAGTVDLGNAIAAIIMLQVFKKFMQILADFTEMDYSTILAYLYKAKEDIVVALILIVSIVSASRIFLKMLAVEMAKMAIDIGKAVALAGLGFLAFAAGVALLVGAIKRLSKLQLNTEQIGTVIVGLLLICGMFVGLLVAAKVFNGAEKGFLTVAGAFALLGLAAIQIAITSALLKKVEWPQLIKALVVLGVITGLMAGLILAAKANKNNIGMKSLIAIIVGMAMMIGELMLLSVLVSNPKTLTNILIALGILAGMMLSYAAVLKAAGSINTGKSWAPILMILLSLGAVFAALYFLSQQVKDVSDLIGLGAIALILVGTVGALMLVLRKFMQFAKESNAGQGKWVTKALAMMGVMIGAFGAVAGILILTSKAADFREIALMAVTLGAAIVGLAYAGKLIIESTKTMKWKEFGKAAAMLGAMIVALGVLTAVFIALDRVANTGVTRAGSSGMNSILATMLPLVLVMEVLALVLKQVSNIKTENVGKGLLALGGMITLFAVLGLVFVAFKTMGVDGSIIGATQAVVLVLAELAAIATLMGMAKSKFEEAQKAIPVLYGLLGAFAILGLIFVAFKVIGVDGSVIGATQAVALVLAELAAIAVLMGVLKTQASSAMGAIPVLYALLGAFAILGLIFVAFKVIGVDGSIIGATQAVALVLTELVLITALLGRLSSSATQALQAVPALLALSMVFGVLAVIAGVLGVFGGSAKDMLGNTQVVMLVLLELSLMMVVLSAISTMAMTAIGAIPTLVALTLVFGALAVIAGILNVFGGDAKGMIAKTQIVMLVLVELSLMMVVLGAIATMAAMAIGALPALVSLTIIFAALAVIAGILNVFGGDAKGMIAKTQIVSLVLVELVAIMAILGLIAPLGVAALASLPALLGLTVIFGILGILIALITNLGEFTDALPKTQVISLVLLELVGITAILGLIAPLGVAALASLPALLGLTVIFGILSVIGLMISQMDLASTEANMDLLTSVVWKLVGICAVLALLSVGAVGMVAGAAAILMLSVALVPLTAAIRDMQSLDMDKVSAGLNLIAQALGLLLPAAVGAAALGVGLVVLAAGIGAVGLACGVAASGVMAFAAALMALTAAAAPIIIVIKNLAHEIVEGFKEKIKEIGNLPSDIIEAIKAKAGSVIDNFKKTGEEWGNALLDSFRKILGWHSPPEFMVKFFKDCGVAVNEDAEGVTDLFDGTGETWGSALEKALSSKISGIDLTSLGNMLGIDLGTSFANGAMPGINEVMQALGLATQDLTAKKKDLVEQFRQGKITEDQLNRGMAELNRTEKKTKSITDSLTDSLGGLTDGLKGTGGAAGSTKDQLANFSESLKSTLESQMNIFDKFEEKAAMSKAELLSNMQSQINGMTNWAANMDKLSTMGIDKGLYQKLAEMGPQGAQYVGAFASMTAEEMAKANELWAQSLVLPGNIAGKISADWAGISGNMVNGLSEGWTDTEGVFHKNILDTSQNAQDEFKKDNEIASPSRVYERFGFFMMRGLRKGIIDNRDLAVTAIEQIARLMINKADELLNEETLLEHGKNIVKGLAKGLKDESVLKELEDASEDVAEIPDRVTRKHNLMESPSRLFMQHGKYIDQGFAIGLRRNQGLVGDAIDEVNDQVIDSMKYTIATIATTLQDGIEDPVITPVLDLSRVSSGIRTLNSAFSTNQALAAAGSMSNLQNGQPVAGVQFIQNNYSPKALSRADIYRQTRNQFAQYRSAML